MKWIKSPENNCIHVTESQFYLNSRKDNANQADSSSRCRRNQPLNEDAEVELDTTVVVSVVMLR